LDIFYVFYNIDNVQFLSYVLGYQKLEIIKIEYLITELNIEERGKVENFEKFQFFDTLKVKLKISIF